MKWKRINLGFVVLAIVAGLTALLLIFQSTNRKPIAPSSAPGELQSCFTPGEECTNFIVQQIDKAKNELLVALLNLGGKAIHYWYAKPVSNEHCALQGLLLMMG